MKKAVVLALAVIMMLGVAGAALAADYEGSLVGTDLVATNSTTPVQVTAKVNPRLTLTLDKTAIDFGSVVPGTAPATQSVLVTVKSNKTWTGSAVLGGQDTEIGLATSTSTGWASMSDYGAKGNKSFTDVYSLNVPWDTDPADYAATVTYTVTQD